MKRFTICLLLMLLCSFSVRAMTLESGGSGAAAFPVRVLMAGDSLMVGLGPRMKEELEGYKNISIIPIGKGSTGLSRPDFYNWPRVLEENLRKHRPQIVVMWVGTNDVATSIYNVEGTDVPCSPYWMRVYAGKILEIARLCQKYKARTIFMSPPVMDKEKWDAKLKKITNLMRSICKYYRLGFIDTRPIFANRSGQYTHTKRMPDGSTSAIRTNDHIHITSAGYVLVMDELLPYLGRYIPEAGRTSSGRRWYHW